MRCILIVLVLTGLSFSLGCAGSGGRGAARDTPERPMDSAAPAEEGQK